MGGEEEECGEKELKTKPSLRSDRDIQKITSQGVDIGEKKNREKRSTNLSEEIGCDKKKKELLMQERVLSKVKV